MNSPAPLRRIATLAALSLTLLPAAAAAQTPSDDGYQADGPNVQNQIESGRSPTEPATETRSNPSDTRESRHGATASLPFTGQDLGMLLAAGALLVGVGAGMRLLLKLPPPAR